MAMPEAAGLFHRAMLMSGQQVTAAGPRAASAQAIAVPQAPAPSTATGRGPAAIARLYCGVVVAGVIRAGLACCCASRCWNMASKLISARWIGGRPVREIRSATLARRYG